MSAPHAVTLDADHALFVSVVGAVAERSVAPAAAAIDAGSAVPDAVLDAADEAGILDLLTAADAAYPELVLLSALAVHRFAEASASVAVRVAAAHTVGAAVLASGEPAATADRIVGAGGPRALVVIDGRAHLRVARNGSKLVISGVVDPVVGAGEAGALLLLVAPVDDEPQVLLVAADAPGVVAGPGVPRCGLRGTTGRVTFSEVAADEAQRIGGPRAVRAAVAHADLLLAAAAAGMANAAIAQARDYMLTRRQFRQPIAEFGGLRAIVGAMAAETDAAWALVEAAARGREPWAGTVPVLAARAAVVATRAAVRVAVDALQMHGGYGYTTEFPGERLVRDAVSLRARAVGGMRSRIADSADAVLGSPAGEPRPL